MNYLSTDYKSGKTHKEGKKERKRVLAHEAFKSLHDFVIEHIIKMKEVIGLSSLKLLYMNNLGDEVWLQSYLIISIGENLYQEVA